MDKILLKSQKIGLQFETILKEIAFLRSNARLVCCAIINASLWAGVSSRYFVFLACPDQAAQVFTHFGAFPWHRFIRTGQLLNQPSSGDPFLGVNVFLGMVSRLFRKVFLDTCVHVIVRMGHSISIFDVRVYA